MHRVLPFTAAALATAVAATAAAAVATGQSTAAGAAGDGERIAFVRDGDLHTTAAAGPGDAVPVRQTEDVESHPTWSADGQWIYFLRRYADGSGGALMITRPDGSEERALAVPEGHAPSELAFSPDRSRAVWVMPVAVGKGKQTQRDVFIAPVTADGLGAATNVTSSSTDEWSPAVGDDGTVVFVSQRHREGRAIYASREVDGTRVEDLMTDPKLHALHPALSPDGTDLVYMTYEGPSSGRDWGLRLMTEAFTDQRSVRRLSYSGGNQWWPEWSPSGASIVFSRLMTPKEGWQVRRIDVDGTDELQLTSGSGGGTQPAWQPQVATVEPSATDASVAPTDVLATPDCLPPLCLR